MFAIHLPKPLELRLTALAREAILEFIDNLEDFYLAEARSHQNCKTISLANVERQLSVKNIRKTSL